MEMVGGSTAGILAPEVFLRNQVTREYPGLLNPGLNHPEVNLDGIWSGRKQRGEPREEKSKVEQLALKVLQAEFISQRGSCVGLDYAWVPERALR